MIVVGRLLSWRQRGHRFDLALAGHPGIVVWQLELGGIKADEARELLTDAVGRKLRWTVNAGELVSVTAPKVKS